MITLASSWDHRVLSQGSIASIHFVIRDLLSCRINYSSSWTGAITDNDSNCTTSPDIVSFRVDYVVRRIDCTSIADLIWYLHEPRESGMCLQPFLVRRSLDKKIAFSQASKVSCVSAELLAEEIVRLRVARQTIHKVQDYSICFEKVYSLLQTFIAAVRYTLQIVLFYSFHSIRSLTISVFDTFVTLFLF